MSEASSSRYLCIHGHFYQPPRENPWLEAVETQPSAAPYHDWNERITAECYAPNGASRIVNPANKILRIVNNYGAISYDFGPTLMSWLEQNAYRTYQSILDGERISRERFGGHSSAMAQGYNHIILPLASERDRITQIRWGVADYTRRFGHEPASMWLPETAADTHTLELMAEHGLAFALLAPHQCRRIRPLQPAEPTTAAPTTDPTLKTSVAEEPAWIDTPNASVDTTRPYLLRFPSGKSIAVFFYDGPSSRAIAFEGLLNSGESFANRLANGFHPDSSTDQLVHVATDGESYGHHHRHGEMALTYALQYFEQQGFGRVTNYSQYLALHPPQWEAEIVDNSSWSCAHGIERWRSDCGCSSGWQGWNQRWRKPLRQGLDQLRDSLAPLVCALGAELFHNLDEARNAYIDVVLAHTSTEWPVAAPAAIDRFLATHARNAESEDLRSRALKLMELERQTMLMYTSCGWFFDDISGIETVQVIAYAARALQFANNLFGQQAAAFEPALLAQLEQAKSNVAQSGDGARIYREQVMPLCLTLEQVAAHYALSSAFIASSDETDIYCYRVRRHASNIYSSGRGSLFTGYATLRSRITLEQQTFSYAVLSFGDQNVTAAVHPYAPADEAALTEFCNSAREAVESADFPSVIRLLDAHFGHAAYTLSSLFQDDRRAIVAQILGATVDEVESSLSNIYHHHASLLHYLSRASLPKPPALALAAQFAVQAGLRKALQSTQMDESRFQALLDLAHTDQIELNQQELSYIADQRMKAAMDELAASPLDEELLARALSLVKLLGHLPFSLDLWQAQNIWHDMLMNYAHQPSHEPLSNELYEGFLQLGRELTIDVEAVLSAEAIQLLSQQQATEQKKRTESENLSSASK